MMTNKKMKGNIIWNQQWIEEGVVYNYYLEKEDDDEDL